MSTSDDDLDKKLARISGRLQAERDSVRAELAKEPSLLLLAELARERFGAKIGWLKTDNFERGAELERGVTICIETFSVKGRRK